LNWWLDHYRNHQIFGIELDPVIAEHTRRRLKRFKTLTVLTGDVCEILPDECSFIYLFNPFDGETMSRFIKKLLVNPQATNGLPRRIIYTYCKFIGQFENNRNFVVKKLVVKQDHPPSALIDCIL
jgi:hypothetical protein